MKKTGPVPEEFNREDIRIESSTCTGEKVIGFFSDKDNKLHYEELVSSDEDIERFYKKYGFK